MPRISHLACLLCIVGAHSAWSSIASAESPPTPSAPVDDEPSDPLESKRLRIEAVGGVGFGRVSIPTRETMNSYGPAAGLRAGLTFPFNLYLGLRFEHFFGASEQYPVPLLALTEYKTGADFVGLSAGYELRIGPAFLRPQIGAGVLALHTRSSCSPAAGSFGDLASQTCAATEGSHTSWAPSVVPALPMGLHFGRFYGFVEPGYYVRKTAGAYALLGAIGIAL